MSRPRPTPIRCTAVHTIAERVIQADFAGYNFESEPDPAAYVELWFAPPPSTWPPPRGGSRSPKRTFTPVDVDVTAGSFSVEFVLHGNGVATDWVSAARPSDTIWAGPMKGGYVVDDSASRVVLVGDDTAIPAMATIIDRFGDQAPTTTIVEVVDADDERTVGSRGADEPIWVHRGEDVRRAGKPTLNLLMTMEVPPDSHWWIAGERDAIRRIRDVVVERFDTPRESIDLNAHWRLGPVDPRKVPTA